MAFIVPPVFRDGQVISGAALDTAFTDIATLVNTTKLDKDNFRPFAGLTNEKKANPYAVVPALVTIPKLTQGPNLAKSYKGLWAWGHYAQYPVLASNQRTDGAVSDKVSIDPKNAFAVDSIQVVSAYQNGFGGADTFYAKVGYRTHLTPTVTLASVTLGAANAMASFDVTATECDYAYLQLDWTTDATGAARTIANLNVVIWLRMLHVP